MIDPKADQAAELLKILARPIRMQIVFLLTQQESINVSAFQNHLQIRQPLVSHYLINMKDKGILTSFRKGNQIHYSLADLALGEAIQLLLASRERP